jgi:mannose-1-phosphate guanylyltransferase/phosphomannomutase
MILAAGYGERLWPLTADRTKPALPVLGKPLVGYVAEYLAAYGITDVIANLHHWPSSVRQALGDGSSFGVHLEYVHEPVILGTSGALDNAKEFFDSTTFVLINGKIITDIDLHAALETHRRTEALATLVLKKNVARELFSIVETRAGFVTRFGGMPEFGQKDEPLMFTGIQILEPRIFEYIPPGVFSHTTTDVYPKAIARGERIAAHVGDGMWHELSTLRRYLDISLALLKTQGRDVYQGARTTIAEGADVADSILWDGVVVERGASMRRSVIGDGVHVRENDNWQDVVVVRNELVEGKTAPAKAGKGHTIGDKFVVPLSQ